MPGFGAEGQQKLAAARVLIAGAGGLGCPAAQYLAAAGVGTIGIADGDKVSPTNLHRQILYGPADVGRSKAVVAREKLVSQNPSVAINVHEQFLDATNVAGMISGYDIVVDCTDNFNARYLINDACVMAGKPVVYGAIYQYEGQVSVWNMPLGGSIRGPHYRDIFPEVNAAMIPDCAEGGVWPMLAGVVGCLQAGEVVKLVTGVGEVLSGKLLIFDARSGRSMIVQTMGTTRTAVQELPGSADVREIEIVELRARADEFELIDVRTKEERDAHSIGGKHIPLEDIMQTQGIQGSRSVVLYCASGKRSRIAAQLLQQRFPQLTVYSLKGGV